MFNHLTEQDLVKMVDELPWKVKQAVQVFFKPKNEFLFSMWKFSSDAPPVKLDPNTSSLYLPKV